MAHKNMSSSVRLGRPNLTTIDAIAQSLALGPIFSGIFVSPLIVDSAGSGAPFAALLGAIGAGCIGWIVVQYARRYGGAGAVYDYVRQAGNPALALPSGLIYFGGTLVLGVMATFLPIGVLISSLLASIGVTLPWWLCAVVAAVGVFTLNHVGVQATARTQLALTLTGAVPVLILIGVILLRAAPGHFAAIHLSHTRGNSIFRGMLFGLTLFTGFEASASLAEETVNPRKSIPIAVSGTLIASAIFYLLVVSALTVGLDVAGTKHWMTEGTPFPGLAKGYIGGWLATWVQIALLVDGLAVASAFTVTTSRGLFALARQGHLPSALARVSKHGTPLGGNLFVLAAALSLTGITALLHMAPMTVFEVAVLWGSFLFGLTYMLLPVMAVRMLGAGIRSWWRWIVMAGAIVSWFLAIYGTVVPFPSYPDRVAVFGALATVAIALAWMMVRWPQLRQEGLAAHQSTGSESQNN